MKKFGLTGGVACGKSTVGGMLQQWGWRVIDTDAIAHRLYEPGMPAYQKIVDAFGPSVLKGDCTVDRASLGQLVFSDPEKRRLLNSLVHPLIRSAWQQEHNDHLLKHPEIPVFVIMPLLFENRLESWFDAVACVGCSRKEQRARLAARGLDAKQVDQRIEAQWPLEVKMEKSQVVLWNNGSFACLEDQARELNRLWQGNA
ncbi:MAG: dephospho-CoA kinase [bacterium]